MERKATNCRVFLRKVGDVEMSRDWFGSVFIVDLNIPKVFLETVTQSAAPFADVYFLTERTGYAVDKIGRNAREMIA